MGVIGNFGKEIIFKVGEEKVKKDKVFKALIPQNIKQEVSGRWTKQDIIGKKPRSEFNGPDLRSFTFTIVLDVMLGYKPHSMLKKIHNIIGKGKVYKLVIGGHKIGKQWKMTKCSESWDSIYGGGELSKVVIDITLEGY